MIAAKLRMTVIKWVKWIRPFVVLALLHTYVLQPLCFKLTGQQPLVTEVWQALVGRSLTASNARDTAYVLRHAIGAYLHTGVVWESLYVSPA